MARQGKAWQGHYGAFFRFLTARLGAAWHGGAGRGEARALRCVLSISLGAARRGTAGHGTARHGAAGQGHYGAFFRFLTARPGAARRGKAGRGKGTTVRSFDFSRRGGARHGMARRGEAWALRCVLGAVRGVEFRGRPERWTVMMISATLYKHCIPRKIVAGTDPVAVLESAMSSVPEDVKREFRRRLSSIVEGTARPHVYTDVPDESGPVTSPRLAYVFLRANGNYGLIVEQVEVLL